MSINADELLQLIRHRLSGSRRTILNVAEGPERRRARNRGYARAWNASNPEKRAALNASWKGRNPEKVRAAKRAWAKANRHKERARARRWRQRVCGNAQVCHE